VELIDKLTVSRLIITFIGAVILFSFVFYFLTLTGNGIAFSFTDEEVPGYFDCLYFSIVTISSLGYGDIRPVGIARFVCSVEVIVGLAFVGLLVSRLASRKQDLHLSIIYKNIVRESLDNFHATFKSLADQHAKAHESIVQYSTKTQQPREEEELQESLRELYSQLKGAVNGLRQYFDYCITNNIVYDRNHFRLLLKISRNLNKILNILNNFPERGRDIFFNSVSKRKIDKSLISVLGMLKSLCELAEGEEILQECSKAEKVVNEIRVIYDIAKNENEYISIQD
jgi:hypothetical protein